MIELNFVDFRLSHFFISFSDKVYTLIELLLHLLFVPTAHSFLLDILFKVMKCFFNFDHSVLVSRRHLLLLKPQLFVFVSLHVESEHGVLQLSYPILHFELLGEVLGLVVVSSGVVLLAERLVLFNQLIQLCLLRDYGGQHTLYQAVNSAILLQL